MLQEIKISMKIVCHYCGHEWQFRRVNEKSRNEKLGVRMRGRTCCFLLSLDCRHKTMYKCLVDGEHLCAIIIYLNSIMFFCSFWQRHVFFSSFETKKLHHIFSRECRVEIFFLWTQSRVKWFSPLKRFNQPIRHSTICP